MKHINKKYESHLVDAHTVVLFSFVCLCIAALSEEFRFLILSCKSAIKSRHLIRKQSGYFKHIKSIKQQQNTFRLHFEQIDLFFSALML